MPFDEALLKPEDYVRNYKSLYRFERGRLIWVGPSNDKVAYEPHEVHGQIYYREVVIYHPQDL
jgi:hypothetical protein